MPSKPQEQPAPERFEDVVSAIESLVEQIESGEVDLEASIDAYERGSTLVARARKMLREAELRIEQVDASAEGEAPGDAS